VALDGIIAKKTVDLEIKLSCLLPCRASYFTIARFRDSAWRLRSENLICTLRGAKTLTLPGIHLSSCACVLRISGTVGKKWNIMWLVHRYNIGSSHLY